MDLVKKQTVGTYWRFTLIELLVVIGIIMILASLLLPALMRTKYLARLVICASNLNQVGVAAIVYAGENTSRFPYRKNVLGPDSAYYSTAYTLRLGCRGEPTNDVPVFVEMGLDQVQCPFEGDDLTTPPVKLAIIILDDVSVADSRPLA